MTKWAGSCIWELAGASTTNLPQPVAPAQAGAARGAPKPHPIPNVTPAPVPGSTHPQTQ
jgi:hypothetical protein